MRTFYAKLSAGRTRRPPHALTRLRQRAQAEEGFLLIEVIISAVLVAVIVIGTFTGYDAVNRISADQRHHNQGAVLAAQAQEQLRTDAANVLDTLELTPHTYTQTVDGTTYTIKQEASYVNDTTQSAECSATGAASTGAKQNGNYLRITSSVTWPQLVAAKRPALTESSIITPPTGSGLELDAINAAEAPVSGVTSTVTYTAIEATLPTTLTGTTGAGGCFVFSGIPATSALVSVSPKLGYVIPSGAYEIKPKEFSIAPNLTTHDQITLDEGGAIKANFKYKGASVTSDSFVAANTSMNVPPDFVVGGTNVKVNTEGTYEPVPLTYATSGTTAKSLLHYPSGDLFPFAKSPWSVYAGDCENNTAGAKNAEVSLKPGELAEVNVPMADLVINLYEGTSGTTLNPTTSDVKATNTACSSFETPNNASAAYYEKETYYERLQKTSGGHLEHPYFPSGKVKVCVAYNNGTTHRTFTVEPTLTVETAREENFYIGKTTEYTSSPSNDKVKVTTSSFTTLKC
jgi:Tfp pilus assembly protein PilV